MLSQSKPTALYIEALFKYVGERYRNVNSDVVQAVQLVDRHQLQDLINARRRRRLLVVDTAVKLCRVPAKQDIECGRFSSSYNRQFGQPAWLACLLVGRTPHSVEVKIRHHQSVLYEQRLDQAEGVLGIDNAGGEARL